VRVICCSSLSSSSVRVRPREAVWRDMADIASENKCYSRRRETRAVVHLEDALVAVTRGVTPGFRKADGRSLRASFLRAPRAPRASAPTTTPHQISSLALPPAGMRRRGGVCVARSCGSAAREIVSKVATQREGYVVLSVVRKYSMEKR
jgi:hypothetical protein